MKKSSFFIAYLLNSFFLTPQQGVGTMYKTGNNQQEQ